MAGSEAAGLLEELTAYSAVIFPVSNASKPIASNCGLIFDARADVAKAMVTMLGGLMFVYSPNAPLLFVVGCFVQRPFALRQAAKSLRDFSSVAG